ncbi:MAG: tRNA pseudouridine(38-40) synthase TruA [Clostridia bacterium]|nr:tRNA pseudouridine(38-40) synthase TruA [Clostridia bacterium]
MKLLLYVSYLGTDFCGYQVQKDKRTVQGELCRAAKELFGFDCDVTGCSRTDSGVHANMFCCTVTKKGEGSIETDVSEQRIPRAINAHLPQDLSVSSAEWVSEDFHPRYDVKYKEYVYKICNSKERDPFLEGRALYLAKQLTDSDIERMNAAAQHFVGEHDFSAFMAQGSAVQSTVRNVKYASVTKEGNVVTFKVAADGFLYNMVRIMTGTLLSVAQGKTEPCDIEKIIMSRDRSKAGMTAPAQGLYLNLVIYK